VVREIQTMTKTLTMVGTSPSGTTDFVTWEFIPLFQPIRILPGKLPLVTMKQEMLPAWYLN